MMCTIRRLWSAPAPACNAPTLIAPYTRDCALIGALGLNQILINFSLYFQYGVHNKAAL